MFFFDDLHKQTLLLADKLINEGLTFDEIAQRFHNEGYSLRVSVHNGYISKTVIQLCKNGKYSFVDIKKRRNGFALWETINLQ